MKKYVILFLIISLGCSLSSNTNFYSQKIENLKSFAKVYGYVKYFHPSDEASNIDWVKFAAYGVMKVLPCNSQDELIKELENVFIPIAPTIKFSNYKMDEYAISQIQPPNSSGYKLTYWQHRGVGFGMKSDYRSPYTSVRVNGLVAKKEPVNYGLLLSSLKAKDYKGKKIRLRARAKLGDTINISAYLRLALVNSDGTSELEKDIINSTEWASYEIKANIGDLTEFIEFGTALKGKAQLFIDNVELSYWDIDSWTNIPLKNADFENVNRSNNPNKNNWYFRGEGYTYEVTESDTYEGKFSAVSYRDTAQKREYGKKIFDNKPRFGEIINESVGNGIYCQFPIVLYSNEKGTFPRANSAEFRRLQKEVNALADSASMLEIRLGNIINSYNVFQHFYPYFKEASVDWEKELSVALRRSFEDKTADDHYVTLEKFTAPLKDGHMYVAYPRNPKIYAPRIKWEWIENKLVITKVLDSDLPLEIGDIVTHVNGMRSEDYFQEIYSRISAGTNGWLDYKAKRKSLLDGIREKMVIRVDGKDIALDRPGAVFNEGSRQSTYEKINEDVYYLNLTRIEMDTIKDLLPELVNSKSIICDLRGYPNRNHMFLSHLLKKKDTSASWMQIPKILYPNQKNRVGFEKYNWFLPSIKPYLGDKQIIFLTDGSAISYAESYMGFVEGYDLATIIGQPTAGTNGNINSFTLAGGFSITWTGMKVVKHDGSQHHAIGIIPDIFLEKTIEGVKEGRDEFLEKAIELTRSDKD
ncbi:S41 family peptidase [Flavobacteriaceae bacterium D16]|nr:S41 family peptidase [Flavobacteriaceae bacterium D16]